jgi:pimeloyl-ACP methyl ester carboxylesterase
MKRTEDREPQVDARTRIVVTEVGKGPAIVILPSIGRGAAEMADLAEALASRGYKVLLPEPRGIGGSVGPDDFTLRDLADDVAALIGGRSPAVVAGHAFGNWVARMTAARHAGLVAGVVLLAAAAREWPRDLARHVETSADSSLPREIRLASLRHAFFAAGNDAVPWLDGWHLDLLLRRKRCTDTVPDDEWRAAGSCPILDLQGSDDPFRPEPSREELTEEFPERAERVTIADASHALPVEQPGRCAEAMAEWIERRRLFG